MALVIAANDSTLTDSLSRANMTLTLAPASQQTTANVAWDLLTRMAGTAIEGLFGLTLGAAAGRLAGWCAGCLYASCFKPVYMSGLAEITHWWMMPCNFARIGAFLGAALGLLLVALIGSYLTTERMAAAYNHGTQNPRELAQMLGLTEAKVQLILNRLAAAGRIEHD
jgi:hypothetical protein